MTRRLPNLLTAGSLLLSLAVCLLWLRGYWSADAVWFVRDGFQLFVASSRGHIAVGVGTAPAEDLSEMVGWTHEVEAPSDLTQDLPQLGEAHGWGGFLYVVQQFGGTTSARVIALPTWALLTVSGLPAAIRLVRQRLTRDRRRSGACTVCGYDLTGNVSGVCPECGTPASVSDGG